ncbi:MAG: C13 family peptidase [Hyphomonas sp.]
MRWQHLFAGALLWAALGMGPAQAEPSVEDVPLKDWAVAILAADWRDSDGAPIDAFENARRDLARAFADVGFAAENITHMSLRPRELGGFSLRSSEVFTAFEKQARSAQAGCLLYFTSHGVPEGMVLGGEGLLSPDKLNGLVDQWCGERPTVVVVSACYSGVFIPALAAPNRLVMSAARPDRSSFGCGAGMIYPVFDNCVLDSLIDADDFVHLASLTRQCVALRERQQRLWPPSEPQARIGADVDDLFVFLNFEREAR